jgi:hypothetical protein
MFPFESIAKERFSQYGGNYFEAFYCTEKKGLL